MGVYVFVCFTCFRKRHGLVVGSEKKLKRRDFLLRVY